MRELDIKIHTTAGEDRISLDSSGEDGYSELTAQGTVDGSVKTKSEFETAVALVSSDEAVALPVEERVEVLEAQIEALKSKLDR